MTNGLSLEELMKEGTYPEEYTEGENWKILHGDTLKLVKAFQPGIFDAVITDPPYASGGTKQNERNRTTNQKYSSMSAANALPDFDGDNKDQRSWTHWMAEWLYDVRKACKKGAPICLFIDWRQYPSITDALQPMDQALQNICWLCNRCLSCIFADVGCKLADEGDTNQF